MLLSQGFLTLSKFSHIVFLYRSRFPHLIWSTFKIRFSHLTKDSTPYFFTSKWKFALLAFSFKSRFPHLAFSTSNSHTLPKFPPLASSLLRWGFHTLQSQGFDILPRFGHLDYHAFKSGFRHSATVSTPCLPLSSWSFDTSLRYHHLVPLSLGPSPLEWLLIWFQNSKFQKIQK